MKNKKIVLKQKGLLFERVKESYYPSVYKKLKMMLKCWR